jgi:hypothetical protein
MLTKVSVLIPTRHRVERLQTLLHSYAYTTIDEEKPTHSELVFRVDDDDQGTQDMLAINNCKMVVSPRLQGYRSMATYFNEMLAASTGDVLMLGNDDMVFRTIDWPALVLAEANKYPDGLFDIGVTTFNQDHFPFSIVSRKAVERIGFIWDPRLVWGDLFLRDVMSAFDRCVRLPFVEIEHDWVGHKPDAVFLEGNQSSPENWNPAYWEKHRMCVAEAVAKLRAA